MAEDVLTPEKVMEMGMVWSKKVLALLPPEELLAVLKPEELLAALKPEERLAGLKAEERLAGLSIEEIERYLILLCHVRSAPGFSLVNMPAHITPRRPVSARSRGLTRDGVGEGRRGRVVVTRLKSGVGSITASSTCYLLIS